MAVLIGGKQFWLWRAVDDEGEVLDLLEPLVGGLIDLARLRPAPARCLPARVFPRAAG